MGVGKACCRSVCSDGGLRPNLSLGNRLAKDKLYRKYLEHKKERKRIFFLV